MATEAIYTKSLGGAEDLLLDASNSPTVIQTRAGKELEITKINSSTIPYSGKFGDPSMVSIKDHLDTKANTVSSAYVIDTVDDFGTVPSGIDTVIVKDMNRGGTFIYDATQSAVNNGGTIFDGWVRQYSGAVNVKWFGAKGDGVADDTVAIQEAIDNVTYILKNGSVFIPAGIYNISYQGTTDTVDKVSDTMPIGQFNNCITIYSSGGNDTTDIYRNSEKIILFGEGRSTVLKIVTDNSIGIRHSLSSCKIQDISIKSGNIAYNNIGIALFPIDVNDTTRQQFTNYNIISNLFIVDCKEAIALTYGAKVAGYASGCWYNTFNSITIHNCKRGIWELGRDSTLFYGGTGRNTYNYCKLGQGNLSNTGFELISGTNQINFCTFENINAGTSPNVIPTAIKITGGVYSSGTVINSPIFEQCTRLLEHDSLYTTAIGTGFTPSNSLLTTALRAQFSGTPTYSGLLTSVAPAFSTDTYNDLNYNTPSYAIRFNNSEREVINSAGYVKFSNDGTFSSRSGKWHEFRTNYWQPAIYASSTYLSPSGSAGVISSELTQEGTDGSLYVGILAGVMKFRVRYDGNVYNTNAVYGSLSDVKLKKDIIDANSQWNDIKNLKFKKFRFKDDKEEILQLGLIAQEVEETSPGLIDTVKDYDKKEIVKINDDGEEETEIEHVENGEVTKSVKYSLVYMKAVKALQEAMERIESLESKIKLLESR